MTPLPLYRRAAVGGFGSGWISCCRGSGAAQAGLGSQAGRLDIRPERRADSRWPGIVSRSGPCQTAKALQGRPPRTDAGTARPVSAHRVAVSGLCRAHQSLQMSTGFADIGILPCSLWMVS